VICESPELEIGLSDVIVNGQFACDVQRFDAPQKLKTLDRVSVRWKTLDGFVAVLHFRILFKFDLVVAKLSLWPWMDVDGCSRGYIYRHVSFSGAALAEPTYWTFH
jgi:hypothetical protein